VVGPWRYSDCEGEVLCDAAVQVEVAIVADRVESWQGIRTPAGEPDEHGRRKMEGGSGGSIELGDHRGPSLYGDMHRAVDGAN
jgi:hypothetical protein